MTMIEKPGLSQVLDEIKDALLKVKDTIPGVHAKVHETDKGLSLLEVKNHSMLMYMTGICQLLSLKLRQAPIADSDALMSLIEQRVILEKIKPIEAKIKYRIDKLIKQTEVAEPQNDALSFKPNLSAFADDQDSEAEEGEAAEKKKTARAGIYAPPKLVPVHYDEHGKAKSNRLSKRAKESLASSRILRDLQDEFGDAPEVQSTSLMDSLATEEIDSHFAERETYEEENFIRLNLTREEKKMRKRKERVTMNDEVNQIVADLDLGNDKKSHLDEMMDYLDAKRSKTKRQRGMENDGAERPETFEMDHNHQSDYQIRKVQAKKRLKRQMNKQNRRNNNG